MLVGVSRDWSRAGHNLEGALTQEKEGGDTRKGVSPFSLLFNAVKPMVRLCVKTLCQLLKEKKEGEKRRKAKGCKRQKDVKEEDLKVLF